MSSKRARVASGDGGSGGVSAGSFQAQNQIGYIVSRRSMGLQNAQALEDLPNGYLYNNKGKLEGGISSNKVRNIVENMSNYSFTVSERNPNTNPAFTFQPTAGFLPNSVITLLGCEFRNVALGVFVDCLVSCTISISGSTNDSNTNGDQFTVNTVSILTSSSVDIVNVSINGLPITAVNPTPLFPVGSVATSFSNNVFVVNGDTDYFPPCAPPSSGDPPLINTVNVSVLMRVSYAFF